MERMSEETINSLGEFGIIDRISKKFQNHNETTIKGIGDDAAVIDCGKKYQLISTDFLVEAIHFDLRYVPLKHLGYKAVAVNVSDIAAMNGIPRQITVNLGISPRFTLEAIDELYEGIRLACDAYKVDLVGGDTSASNSGTFLSITAIGECDKDKVAYRNGAKENDILCVTGDLGAAYIGLNILEREKEVFLENSKVQPELDDHAYTVGRQLKPEARMDIIHDLRDFGVIPTSMIDVSDGLASEIMHITQQSDCGAAIYEDKIPVSSVTYNTAVNIFKIDPITCMLNGGEDYELLFTVKQSDYDKIKNHPDISVIGYIQSKDKGVNLVTKGEQIIPIQAQGWNHLRTNK